MKCFIFLKFKYNFNNILLLQRISLNIIIFIFNETIFFKQTRKALIEEEYAEYNQELVEIKIEQQLETNTEDPFNHIM